MSIAIKQCIVSVHCIGTGHLNTLKGMLQRAFKHQVNNNVPKPAAPSAAMAAAAAASAASAAADAAASADARQRASIRLGIAKTRGGTYSLHAVASPVHTPSSSSSAGGTGGGITAASASDSVADGSDSRVLTSHFKQSYLINKLLFPAETDTTALRATQASVLTTGMLSTTAGDAVDAQDTTVADLRSEEEFLLQEMVDYEDALGATETELYLYNTNSTAGAVKINPFIERLLLHGKLSYDENITGVMAPSLAEVALTTWTLQVSLFSPYIFVWISG
jgi:hypothetical protein